MTRLRETGRRFGRRHLGMGMNARSSRRLGWLSSAVLLALLAVFAVSSGAASTGAPTITTDKADYAAGSTVILTGAGWGSQEEVQIVVNDTINQSWQHKASVTADTDGGFTHSFTLPTYFVSDYDVTAKGPSGTVTTTFTDAPAKTDLDQCRNGPAATPNDCKDLAGSDGWQNGNVGDSQA